MANTQFVREMPPFDMENGEDFTEYSERFEQFLLANKINEAEMKRAVFLSTIGGPSYKLLRGLLGEEVKTTAFTDIVKALKDHLQPAPNVIAERYRFNKRDRKHGESVNAYIAELRKYSEHCAFGGSLNEYLRDRFVCGLNSQPIQQKLLAVNDLDLTKALEIARSFEAASRDAKLLGATGGVTGIHQATRAEEEEPDCVLRLQQQQRGRGQDARDNRSDKRECYRCGNQGHISTSCPYSTFNCRRCGKQGHLEKRCRSEKKESGASVPAKSGASKPAAIRKVCACTSHGCGGAREPDQGEFLSMDPLSLYLLGRPESVDPVMVEVRMNGESVRMEVDTGAAVSVMSQSSYERIRDSRQPLRESGLKLKTYTGEIVSPQGVASVDVVYQDQQSRLPITVVEGNVPNLLGRDWLSQLRLRWEELFPLDRRLNVLEDVQGPVAELVAKFPGVFTNELGCLKNFKVNIPVPEGTQPKYCKTRPVPYAMKSRVEEELDRLEKQGVWKRVQYSKWAAPMVAVLKDPRDPTGPIRICGDFKQTVNKVAPVDTYPIPSTIDQLAMLAGGEKFTKLDLSQAYQQLELDDPSRELLTINTHQGLYQPSRLQFGVHSATGMFQREMDSRLCRIPMTKVRVDDILVSGRNDAEHLQNLRLVLEELARSGLTLRISKCSFMKDEVTYCGYVINKQGAKPMPGNVEAVVKAPAPTNLTELRGFLGMVNYYNNYVDGLATITEPLHKLMRKGVPWRWTEDCNEAFEIVKGKLSGAPLLTHFDLNKPLVVHCDASQYGLGVVLSHVMEDGSEKPVGYGSRTLTLAERNYATVEKEGLALVYAVKKFHQYLFGNRFIMYTDHKPLLGLFSESCPLPARAAARVLRWALLLSAYDYVLKYREGAKNGNADGLSRLPLDMRTGESSQKVVSVALMELVRAPVTEAQLRRSTRTDAVLGMVLRRILEGGLDKEEGESLKPYRSRCSELSTEGGVVLWGARVVVPESLRGTVLKELHEVHPGINRMKALARSYVWWPGIDADIERTVRNCRECQLHQSKPAAAPPHFWEYASEPWERVHIDHAGPVNGESYLVIVDSYSKWLEVERVSSTDAKTTCKILRRLFAVHGLPRVVVSDNGPGFASEEFNVFLQMNGVKHLYSAPYHPSSNGQAERMVRVLKESLKRVKQGDIDTRLSRLLFRYRITPHTLTGQSPSELLLGRRVRSALSLLRPNLQDAVKGRQEKSIRRSRTRAFEIGDDVLITNFRGEGRWLPGVVVEIKGATNYEVQLEDGRVAHRHVDQMVSYRQGVESCSTEDVFVPDVVVHDGLHDGLAQVQSGESQSVIPSPEQPTSVTTSVPGDQYSQIETRTGQYAEEQSSTETPEADERTSPSAVETSRPEPTSERRAPSTRVRRPPTYLADYVP